MAHPASAQTLQAPAFYRYRVGDVVVVAINDGVLVRPLEGLIRNASAAEAEAALAEACMPAGVLALTFTSLAIESPAGLTLIDTGLGDLGPPTAGRWMTNFQAASFAEADVKTVVISHFHGDHINGLRLKDGTRRFAGADIWVPAAEWDYWMADARLQDANAALKGNAENCRRVFDGMADKVRRYASGDEIVPGLTAVAAPGHTPGHMTFSLASGPDRLLVMSDVNNHPALFLRNPDWQAAFDVDPEQTVKTRRKLLGEAADGRVRVAFYHAPFPATGHVVRDGERFRFVPVDWTPVV